MRRWAIAVLLIQAGLPGQLPYDLRDNQTEKFTISGFADFLTTYQTSYPRSNTPSQQLERFSQNALNLRFGFAPNPDWRFNSEVRFLNFPQGYLNSAQSVSESCQNGDPALCEEGEISVRNLSRPTNIVRFDDALVNFDTGALFIERAYIEYTGYRLFRVRAGKMRTPHGIWSQDNNAVEVTSVRVPNVVNPFSLVLNMPVYQTGVMLLGDFNITSGTLLRYQALAGDGRTNYRDGVQTKSALLHTELLFTSIAPGLEVLMGGTAYHGDKIDIREIEAGTIIYNWKHRDNILGGHIRTEYLIPGWESSLVLQAEYLNNKINQDTKEITFSPGAPREARRSEVAYIQGELHIGYIYTPYVRYDREWYDVPRRTGAIDWHVYTSGLHTRLDKGVALKVEFSQQYGQFNNFSTTLFGYPDIKTNNVWVQLAISF